jgi:tRNA-splicing ligase RtcB
MSEIEMGAQQQIYAALELPFLKRLAVLPDVHQGYDLPIGGVALLDGKVSPFYVGFDLGCGCCLTRTGRPFEQLFHGRRDDASVMEANVRPVYRRLYDAIPVGLNSNHARRQEYKPFKFSFDLMLAEGRVDAKRREQEINDKLGLQCGTLGGGNHFLELGISEQTGEVCVTIHSGSRGPGWKTADVYMRTAGKERFFDLDSALGQAYMKDLGFFLDYALENRRRMMIAALTVLGFTEREQRSMLDGMINENHNHAVVRPDGVLHRKGATPADKGQPGVIPISMGAGVYVTEGLGNEEYLSSASHGAGRLMGRSKAKKTLDLAEFQTDMVGILAPVGAETLDEAPRAYKGEDYVISAQKDVVVKITDVIRPFAVVKGGKEGEDNEVPNQTP